METGHSKGELDEMINFKFQDPVNGIYCTRHGGTTAKTLYRMDTGYSQETTQGTRSLRIQSVYCCYFQQLSKQNVDLFESKELLVPPSCSITVWAKIADDTEEFLSYTVGLIGVDSDSKEICINRFLEISISSTTGIMYY